MCRQIRIQQQLTDELTPSFLEVADESKLHHVPVGAQTHFKVTLVATKFIGLSLLQRHQWVNQLLQAEFALGMHALSLHLYSPEEWARKTGVKSSPSCLDGYEASRAHQQAEVFS
jgi:BolA protein